MLLTPETFLMSVIHFSKPESAPIFVEPTKGQEDSDELQYCDVMNCNYYL